MSTRKPRNPLVSLLMFLVLVGVGYAAYKNQDKIRNLFGEKQVIAMGPEQAEAMVDFVEDHYAGTREFEGVRGTMSWRPSSKSYRLEVLVTGESDAEARTLCEKICKALTERAGAPVAVWAYDKSDRNTAHALP